MADTDVKSCAECGASIYPEHLSNHRAGYWGGKLVCVHCYNDHHKKQVTIDPQDIAPHAASPAHGSSSRSATTTHSTHATQHETMTAEVLEDESEQATAVLVSDNAKPTEPTGNEIKFSSLDSSKVSFFGKAPAESAAGKIESRFRRHPHHDGKGAIRCRIFHAKLNDSAIHFMEDQINDWVDHNPEIEIKHASTQVGVVEGKNSEPHLIITVFY